MEFELQQLAGRAVRDDQEDADERDQHAGELPARGRLALEHPGAQQHEQRGGRVEQHGIDRRGGLESEIDQGLEYGHAGEREQRQQAGMAPQRRARSRKLGQGKRRKHQRRDQPAPEIERHRLERVAQRASNDPVPRPKEVCQRKQRKCRRPRGPQSSTAPPLAASCSAPRSGMPNSSLSAASSMRLSRFGNSSPNAPMRVSPRAARFMNACSSAPNRSSRALAKPPRSLVLSALPATMNELPKTPGWAVLP